MKGFFSVRNGKFVLTPVIKTSRASPKRGSCYLASAGSWQFSEIKHPGTSGIVSVLFVLASFRGFANIRLVRENASGS